MIVGTEPSPCPWHGLAWRDGCLGCSYCRHPVPYDPPPRMAPLASLDGAAVDAGEDGDEPMPD